VFKSGQSGRRYVGGDFDVLIPNEKRIVFEGGHFSWFGINGPAEDIWFEDCVIGPRGQAIHPMLGPGGGFGGPPPKRITFNRCKFVGMHQATQNDHTEGLQMGAVDTLWIKDCTFGGVSAADKNHVFDLFFNCWDTICGYVLVENTLLYQTSTLDGSSFYTVLIGSGVDASPITGPGIIRNCQIGQPISVDPAVASRWDTSQGNVPLAGRTAVAALPRVQRVDPAQDSRIALFSMAYMLDRRADPVR
jgi:hypothetical protein